MSYVDSFIEYTNGDYYKVHQLGLDVTVGRRIFDFSYLTVGYQYRPIADSNSQNWTRWGSQDTNVDTNKNALYFAYGWNSEDDPYFPTQGSRLYYRAGISQGTSRQDYETLLYRKTWKTSGNSLWAIQLGGTPATENRMAFGGTQLISFSYARPISKSNDFGAIKEGRWYVEPRMGAYGIAPDKTSLWELGITAGIRLDVKSIGIVDLYVIGSASVSRK
jgi:hypothetical protein